MNGQLFVYSPDNQIINYDPIMEGGMSKYRNRFSTAATVWLATLFLMGSWNDGCLITPSDDDYCAEVQCYDDDIFLCANDCWPYVCIEEPGAIMCGNDGQFQPAANYNMEALNTEAGAYCEVCGGYPYDWTYEECMEYAQIYPLIWAEDARDHQACFQAGLAYLRCEANSGACMDSPCANDSTFLAACAE